MILQMSADGQFTVLPLKVIMCYTSCELAVWLECDERDKVELEPKKFNFSWFISENCVNPSKSHKTTNALNTDEKGGIPDVLYVIIIPASLQSSCLPLECVSRTSMLCAADPAVLCSAACSRGPATLHSRRSVRLKWWLPASYSYKELINLAALIIIIKIGLQGYVSSPSLIYSCNFSKKYAVSSSFLNTQDSRWKYFSTATNSHY